jgi:phthalate 4,5-dioxygenase oxygenase subunit
MLTKEQNDAITITDAGTPGGELLRRYWQPVALSTELPAGGAPVPVGLLGEELWLFRDRHGDVALEHRHRAYPVVEKGGAFFAYLGPGEPPEFPNYDFLTLPEENIHVHKLFIDCNYLQANEGNYDPAHVGFLHRSFDPNRRPGLNFGALKLVGVTKDELNLADVDPGESPRLEVEETSFGIRIFQNRSAGPGRQ